LQDTSKAISVDDFLKNTSDPIFDVPKLVQSISGVMTLEPGDVIATGTPPGVGPMKRGDAVEVEIEGIGVLRHFEYKKVNEHLIDNSH
jgi:2-keto-4-pentenoate hydratase/2-oxohepta-3-ene-1,7-dioic acid hydratase in catechol pathway